MLIFSPTISNSSYMRVMSIWRYHITSIVIPMINTRQPHDRLLFIIGHPIHGEKTSLFWEGGHFLSMLCIIMCMALWDSLLMVMGWSFGQVTSCNNRRHGEASWYKEDNAWYRRLLHNMHGICSWNKLIWWPCSMWCVSCGQWSYSVWYKTKVGSQNFGYQL